MMTLNRFLSLRRGLVAVKRAYYVKIWGMDLHPTCTFSLSVKFDKTYPAGVHVGQETYIAFDVAILTHDLTRGLYVDTRIGSHCFIGARSIILPGIVIGEGSIVAAGSVVTKSVPPGCIVAGNPAAIVRHDIAVGPYGRLPIADSPERRSAAGGIFDSAGR
jgi:acetyltransferase-like isoleucine patch superfamily enzyme